MICSLSYRATNDLKWFLATGDISLFHLDLAICQYTHREIELLFTAVHDHLLQKAVIVQRVSCIPFHLMEA